MGSDLKAVYSSPHDHNNRYLKMDLYTQCMAFSAQICLQFPSPSYKYIMSDKQVEQFAQRLCIEWSRVYNKLVDEVLGGN